MSTTAQIFLVVATGMVFLVRLAVALYGAQADKRSAEIHAHRNTVTMTGRMTGPSVTARRDRRKDAT